MLELNNGDTVTVIFAGEGKSLGGAVFLGNNDLLNHLVFEAPIGSGEDVETRTVLVKNYEAIIVTKKATD
jgi:hypothetical protein